MPSKPQTVTMRMKGYPIVGDPSNWKWEAHIGVWMEPLIVAKPIRADVQQHGERWARRVFGPDVEIVWE